MIKRLACVSLVALVAACGSAPVGPGFYRVERGDTLSKIARSHRQSVQSIARWNNLTNPDSIEVGQVLRVEPPNGARGLGRYARRRRQAQRRATLVHHVVDVGVHAEMQTGWGSFGPALRTSRKIAFVPYCAR